MAMECAALSRRRACVSLVTRRPDSGELGAAFNPFFDIQVWDDWRAHAKHPDGIRPCVQTVDMPVDRPEGLVDGLGIQIIGQVVAEILVDGAPDASASVLRIDQPSRETWRALSRAGRYDSRLSQVERARRWRDLPIWRRIARRTRTLPAAICSQISRRVLCAVGADGAVPLVWFSAV